MINRVVKMQEFKKALVYILAIVYIIVAPILVKIFLSNFSLWGTLNTGINVTVLVFVIFNTITVIKLLINYDKYGSPFKKIRKYTDNELIISEINNLNTYQKILVVDNNLIVINESGVFEFATFNKTGTVKGDIKDLEWMINNKKITNPFIIKDNIYHYFILQSGIIFKVTGVWLTTRKFIYNTLEKRLNERIYDKEKIDEIYNTLKVKYGNNEN